MMTVMMMIMMIIIITTTTMIMIIINDNNNTMIVMVTRKITLSSVNAKLQPRMSAREGTTLVNKLHQQICKECNMPCLERWHAHTPEKVVESDSLKQRYSGTTISWLERRLKGIAEIKTQTAGCKRDT